MRIIKTLLFSLFFALIVGVCGLFVLSKSNVLPYISQAKFQYFSCAIPFEYSFGTIDKGFNITQKEFEATVNLAIKQWEDAYGKDLFVYNPKAEFTINLLFDRRQLETNILQRLDKELKEKKTAYTAKEKEYMALRSKYQQMLESYHKAVAAYDKRAGEHRSRVDYWNSRGGAPEGEYQKLIEEQQSLQKEYEELEKTREELNKMVDTLNSKAQELNTVGSDINKTVEEYNSSGQTIREEFEQGLYIQDEKGKRIEIYQFENKESLLNVLTHEFGHALGLMHNDNPNSVMYRLHVENKKQGITADDLATLHELCGNPTRNAVARFMEKTRIKLLEYLPPITVTTPRSKEQ